MKWLDKWFLKKSMWAWDEKGKMASKPVEEDWPNRISISKNSTKTRHNIQSRGMTFVVYPASGGHIVEYQSYNEATDQNEGKLHIIRSDDDIGQALGHIVTLEYLRK